MINQVNINDWLVFIAIFFGIFSLLGITELFRVFLKLHPDSTRKLIHIIVGTTVSLCPILMQSNLPLILLCLIFIFVNTMLLKSKTIDSMNKASRISYGTIYFPLSILILATLFWEKPITYIISIWILTLADPFAAFIGEKSYKHFVIWKDKKSLQGSLAMFSMSFIVSMIGTDVLTRIYDAAFFIPLHILFGLAIFTSISATLSELISNRGTDNLSIPICVFISYEIYLINYTHGNLSYLLSWTFISMIIFYTAFRLKSVQANGAISGYLIGIFVFGSGGIKWIAPLILFFISSSILSKINGKPHPKRDIIQILANGFIACLLALLYFFNNYDFLLPIFYGSLAATTADTWGTEIGYLSKSKPRLILSNRIVEKGTSGGITILGTIGSIMGSALIASALVFFNPSYKLFFSIFISGIIGSFFDSIIGRKFQAKFYCTACNKIIEDRNHCGQRTNHSEGKIWIDNNMVNFLNACIGALSALTLIQLF